MEAVTASMTDVSANMTAVSGNVAQISGNLSLIATDMGEGTDAMRNMLVKMDKMNSNIGVMTVPVYQMRDDMGHLSKNIHDVSSPMKMIPW
jgi:methyl-accepting chemotaxis protein